MQFSGVATLIDATVLNQLQGKPALKGASLYLYVLARSPFVLEDKVKLQLTASEDDIQAHEASFEKITEGSNICLAGVEVHIEYAKGYKIQNIEISSKKVITDIGSTKEKEIKNFELKLSLIKKDGLYQLAISTFNYLRRMERQELAKKHYKPSKVDLLSFIPSNKNRKHGDLQLPISQDVASLDSESVSLLSKLLKFVDKEELFRVLLKKPLKDKQSKKSVRLSIIPTDIESETEAFEIKKKTY